MATPGTARRGGIPGNKKVGMKSLTSNPAARRNKKLPVTATASNIQASYAIVPKDTKHVVVIKVNMPYTKAEFDDAKQTSFKKAIAKIAATSEKNIELVITEATRRAGV
jgi:hypothetical protein